MDTADEEDGEHGVPNMGAPVNDEPLGLIDPKLQDPPANGPRVYPKMIILNGNSGATGPATLTVVGSQDLSVAAPTSKGLASEQSDLELDPPPTANPPPPISSG